MSRQELSRPQTDAGRVPRLVRVAQAIAVGPLGVLVAVAAVVFVLVAPPSSMSAADWAVAVWAVVGAAVFVAAGLALGGGSETARRVLAGAAIVHVVFGVVKLLGYDEPEAMLFVGLDLAVLLLVTLPGVRAFCGAGRRGRPASSARIRSGGEAGAVRFHRSRERQTA